MLEDRFVIAVRSPVHELHVKVMHLQACPVNGVCPTKRFANDERGLNRPKVSSHHSYPAITVFIDACLGSHLYDSKAIACGLWNATQL